MTPAFVHDLLRRQPAGAAGSGFTYRLPETLRHRVRPAAASWYLLAPVSSPDGAGAARDAPEGPRVKEVLRLVDEEPVLDAELLSLGRWIAQYYCAPLGEVLREHDAAGRRSSQEQALFADRSGRDAARQLLLGADEEDPALQMLRCSKRGRSRRVSAEKTAQRAARDSFAGEEEASSRWRIWRPARSAARIGRPAARVVVGVRAQAD